MQVFILDENILKNVSYYFDTHVRKIFIEAVQILSTVSRYYQNFIQGYKIFQPKTNIVKWANDEKNWCYLFALAVGLGREYEYRFKKTHKTSEVLRNLEFPFHKDNEAFDLMRDNKYFHLDYIQKIVHLGNALEFCDDFCYRMPDNFIDKEAGIVESYRHYYFSKKDLAKWTRRPVPEWWSKNGDEK